MPRGNWRVSTYVVCHAEPFSLWARAGEEVISLLAVAFLGEGRGLSRLVPVSVVQQAS